MGIEKIRKEGRRPASGCRPEERETGSLPLSIFIPKKQPGDGRDSGKRTKQPLKKGISVVIF
jgi:hypothetical protein